MRRARLIGVGGGIVVALLGLWGALIPLIGPYFNFGFSPNSTWHFTTDRVWLTILPGALAFVAGILLIFAHRRSTGLMAGWMAVIAGAWFVVGPAVSLLWNNTTTLAPIGAPLGGNARTALEYLATFYALGLLISGAGIAAMARYATLTRVPEDRTTPVESEQPTRLSTGEVVI